MSAEVATSYASLILADAEIDITSDKLLALTKAAKVTVEPIWAEVFSKAVAGKNLKEILFAIGASGPAAAASGDAAAASSGDAAPAEAAKEEEEEESDEEMGMGLFD